MAHVLYGRECSGFKGKAATPESQARIMSNEATKGKVTYSRKGGWERSGLDGIGLDWIGVDWIEWIALTWIVLGWAGLAWLGLHWMEGVG